MVLGFLRSKHARLQGDLSAYLDGELLPDERFELEHHLDGCPGCRGELEELRTISWATTRLRETQVARSYAITAGMLEHEPGRAGGIALPAVAGSRSLLYLVAWGAAGLAALALGAGAARILTQAGGSGAVAGTGAGTAASTGLARSLSPTVAATAKATISAVAASPTVADAQPTPTAAPVTVARNPAPVANSGTGSGQSAPAVIGPGGQPGGTVVVALPQRPGAAPAAAAVSAAAPTVSASSGAVAAAATRGNPGAIPTTSPAVATAAPVPIVAQATPATLVTAAGAPASTAANAALAAPVLVPPTNPVAAAAAPVRSALTPTPTATPARAP